MTKWWLTIEWDWKAAPVTLGGDGVMAQYADNDRWNGWLNPWLDPWGIMFIWENYLLPGMDDDNRHDLEWLDNGTLKFTEYSDDEPYEHLMEPNEDGLYAFMGYGWCWYEDDEYGATDEWKAWSHEQSSVWADASNAKNMEQHNAGNYDRIAARRANQEAADAAASEWEKTHPEPPKYPENKHPWDIEHEEDCPGCEPLPAVTDPISGEHFPPYPQEDADA